MVLLQINKMCHNTSIKVPCQKKKQIFLCLLLPCLLLKHRIGGEKEKIHKNEKLVKELEKEDL
jgi:hypothetical protein